MPTQSVSSFFQTLVAAASEASAALVGNVALIDKVYQNYKPISAGNASSIEIPLPDMSPFSDIGIGSMPISVVGAASVDLPYTNHPGKAYQIPDFSQFQSAAQIRTQFIDSMFKRAIEYLNGQICALISTANFGGYGGPTNSSLGISYNSQPPIPTTGGVAQLAAADWAKAWANLAAQKVPVNDWEDMFLMAPPGVYANMLTNNTLTQGSQVGYEYATKIRQGAAIGQQFSNQSAWDQQMPTNSNALVSGGTVATTSGSATLTGTGTTFTNDLTVGASYNIVGISGPVVISAITSNTTATLSANATAAVSGASMSIPNICLLFHKYAIALGLRPMPDPDDRVVDYTTVFVKGVPMRLMLGYSQLNTGYMVSVDFGYALGVVRPNLGQILLC